MLQLKTEYIHTEPIGIIKGKDAYVVVNNKSDNEIACISWYPPWRKYVMVTDLPAVFDIKCLESIIKFINELSNPLEKGVR